MDANCSPTNVLSSWDHFILFQRTRPDMILCSLIIPRDPTSSNLYYLGHRDRPFETVQQGWTPLKLLFSLLLEPDVAPESEVEEGFAHKGTAHLVMDREPSPKKRKLSGNPQAGVQENESQDSGRRAGDVLSFNGSLGADFKASLF